MTLNDVSYKKAINSLLLASGLQAKLHNNILYVGPNVRNTVFDTRSTDVYQLNQISASSAADYLANLGASVTKTFTITTSVTSEPHNLRQFKEPQHLLLRLINQKHQLKFMAQLLAH